MSMLDSLWGVEPQRQWRGKSVSVIQLFIFTEGKRVKEKGRGEDVSSPLSTGTWGHASKRQRGKPEIWAVKPLTGHWNSGAFHSHRQMWVRQLQTSTYIMIKACRHIKPPNNQTKITINIQKTGPTTWLLLRHIYTKQHNYK